jgi:GNAT superfamily N-acetyltransferase
MAVVLRSARPDERDLIAGIHRDTALQAYAGIFPPESDFPWQATLDRWRTYPHHLVVAELDDAPADAPVVIGFAAFDADELAALYVLPAYWGHGIGARLLEAAGGVSVLWVLEGNTNARRFYEQHGWQPDGARRTNPHAPDVAELRYRRS